MKWRKEILPRFLAAVLVGNFVLCTNLDMVLAKQNASRKEEVIYAILDHSGRVTGLHVVNSFLGGDIVDYGTYTDIKNLTTNDEIKVDGDLITFHTDAKHMYYQGDLKKKDIPWNIKIRYWMDGKEYKAKEIAGMSGKLEISIDITRNENCDPSFWEGYALQAAVTLDTEVCSNIVAEGASIANVGSNKQLTYMILPGKGADLKITADVEDFAMEAITLNGVRLDLNFDVDASAMTEQMQELQNAVLTLKNGAGELGNGTNQMNQSAKGLYDGSSTLNDGTKELNDGIQALNQGIASMQTALHMLNGNSGTLTGGSEQIMEALRTLQASLAEVSMHTEELVKLTDASGQVKAGIDALRGGLQEVDGSIDAYYQALAGSGIADINAYAVSHDTLIGALEQAAGAEGIPPEQQALYQQAATLLRADQSYIYGSSTLIGGIDAALDGQNGELMTGAAHLSENYAVFHKGLQSMTESLNTLGESMKALKEGVDAITENYGNLNQGIYGYTAAVAQMEAEYSKIYQGSIAVAEGAAKLCEGTQNMMDGTKQFYAGTSDLMGGMEKLSNGTKELYARTDGMDEKFSGEMDAMIEGITGKNVETVSFVSEKNTNIESVLFVIRTPMIEKEKKEEVLPEKKEETGFWKKFLDLFER